MSARTMLTASFSNSNPVKKNPPVFVSSNDTNNRYLNIALNDDGCSSPRREIAGGLDIGRSRREIADGAALHPVRI